MLLKIKCFSVNFRAKTKGVSLLPFLYVKKLSFTWSISFVNITSI